MDDAAFDRLVSSAAYRKFVAEVRALSAQELPWLDVSKLRGKAPLDRAALVDSGANHRGIFRSRLEGEDVVVKRGPLRTLAHEMRTYLILNKLGLGPRAFGLVEVEPGSHAIVLERLPEGVDTKVVVRRARAGVEALARELAASGVPVTRALVDRVRQVVLRMEAGGFATAEDLQLRLGKDGSVEPFDVEGVALGVTRAYGQMLPSPVESAEPLLDVLGVVAGRGQRVFEPSKSR
jgi:hypothetical protein